MSKDEQATDGDAMDADATQNSAHSSETADKQHSSETADKQADAETADAQATAEPTTQVDAEAPSLKQQLADAQSEAAKHQDTALRHLAELENIRRRTAKDIEAAHKFATEKFAKELLNVADSMTLGLKAADEPGASVDSLKEGMKLTMQQLNSTFESLNIELIDANGVAFNPDLHEAITTAENPDLAPNTVMDVIQKGYTLNGRLLRPSRVIVSKK